MTSSSPSPVHKIEDYSPCLWFTPKVHLRFDLDPHLTVVRADYEVKSNGNQISPLFLNGENLEFLSLRVNGKVVDPSEYKITDLGLELIQPPSEVFQLTVENRICPNQNTSLEGLYQSGSMLCTQNEPEGFRKIVYSIDRPDNMMQFTVTIAGDPSYFPVMLSNGNLKEEHPPVSGKREVVWEDPFPKPTYLFALVAGELIETKDEFVTKSGRIVTLKIFVEKGNEEKVSFAFESLKQAMKWDEDTFGLEYDLDLFMIVAVEDFNMGAMENKGLNLFNAKLVLADKKSATDETFESIMAVIGHEYFHNWTGNRVTLRNWFNLTLKEGLTVFRDQWFTEDMTDPAVKRIKDILFLKEHQFPEDQGPMAHPIIPKSYTEMNNFYTVTVYEKGAEVIRLVSQILGRDVFKKGLQDYLTRFDGQGVTFEEFISSMERAHGKPIPYLRNWYHRSGTPIVQVEESFDQNNQEWVYTLNDKSDGNLPLVFVNSYAAFDSKGTLITENKRIQEGTEDQIRIKTPNDSKSKPIVSFFRGLSSPILLKSEMTKEEIRILAEHEPDGVSRFFSFQNLIFLWMSFALKDGSKTENLTDVLEIIQSSFKKDWDKTYFSFYLTFPSLNQFCEHLQFFDYKQVESLRKFAIQTIAETFTKEFQFLYEENRKTIPKQSKEEIGKRKLKNTALYYLLHHPKISFESLAISQQREAKHMSEEIFALRSLIEIGSKEKEQVISLFYDKWKQDALVLDVWFAAQVATGENRISDLERLEKHSKFNLKNPNKVRSLYFSFARNPLSFHETEGKGYVVIAERIKQLNGINPQIAAGLTKLFSQSSKQIGNLPMIAKRELEGIQNLPQISKDLGEVVGKIIKSL